MGNTRKKAAKKLLSKPPGKLEKVDLREYKFLPDGMTRCFKNNRYNIQIKDHQKTTNGKCILAMIQRWDNRPIPNHWKELQKIKNEIFGTEAIGIEYYPPESKLLDDFNFYWLCVFENKDIPELILE